MTSGTAGKVAVLAALSAAPSPLPLLIMVTHDCMLLALLVLPSWSTSMLHLEPGSVLLPSAQSRALVTCLARSS
jgi:hypothetical protein